MKTSILFFCFVLYFIFIAPEKIFTQDLSHSTYQPHYSAIADSNAITNIETQYYNPKAPVLKNEFLQFQEEINKKLDDISSRLNNIEKQLGKKVKADESSSFSDIWTAITDLQNEFKQLKNK